jgi:hypothetical protein
MASVRARVGESKFLLCLRRGTDITLPTTTIYRSFITYSLIDRLQLDTGIRGSLPQSSHYTRWYPGSGADLDSGGILRP